MARPVGSVQDRRFKASLIREIDDAMGDPRKLDAIATALVAKAMDGDIQAIREFADRIDGKPAQESNVTIQHRKAVELSDDELAVVAAGSSEGVATPPIDPSQLN